MEPSNKTGPLRIEVADNRVERDYLDAQRGRPCLHYGVHKSNGEKGGMSRRPICLHRRAVIIDMPMGGGVVFLSTERKIACCAGDQGATFFGMMVICGLGRGGWDSDTEK